MGLVYPFRQEFSNPIGLWYRGRGGRKMGVGREEEGGGEGGRGGRGGRKREAGREEEGGGEGGRGG